MLKQIIASTFGALITTFCFAGSMGDEISHPVQPKQNIYFGLGFGGVFMNNNFSRERVRIPRADKYSRNIDQFVGNLYAGYGYTWSNQYFLGLEANTYFPNLAVDFITPDKIIPKNSSGILIDYQYTLNDYLGLDLLPGKRLTSNSLLYGRMGLSFRNVNSTFDKEYASLGGRFGVGAAYEIAKHFGVSLDYFYTYFPTMGYFNGKTQINLKSYQNYIGFSLIYST